MKIHTRLLFAFSQFEIYHNIVMLLPKTSSSNPKSLHSKPENKKEKMGKTDKARHRHLSFKLRYPLAAIIFKPCTLNSELHDDCC